MSRHNRHRWAVMRLGLYLMLVAALILPLSFTGRTAQASAPVITLNPTSGPPGTTVNITGTGFAPYFSSIIHTAAGRLKLCPEVADASGNFETTFIVPSVGYYPYTCSVQTYGSAQVQASFTITAPTDLPPVTLPLQIILNPTSGPPGTAVNITGTGFPPYHILESLTLEGTSLPCPAVVADASGNFEAISVIPTISVGTYYVSALCGGLCPIAYFTITEPSGPPPAIAPQIVLNPASGPPGTTVNITGAGFPAYFILSTLILGELISINPCPAVTTNASGGFAASFVVPDIFATAMCCANTVTAVCGNVGATADFTITGPSVPIAEALASISGKYQSSWGFNSVSHTWLLNAPSAPPYVNSLGEFARGQGYWIHATENCALTYSTLSYPLYTGWNLIGWGASADNATPLPQALDGVVDKVQIIWAFDAPTQSWKVYDLAPGGATTLQSLVVGHGYWMRVTEDCQLQSGANTYDLKTGWNLVGWLG